MGNRIVTAILYGAAAFFISGFVSCAGLTFLVRNSHDGQAGMGAAFGGFYIACVAALIAFVVSLVRSSPSRMLRNATANKC
jgi:hypothetical protein